MPLLPALLRRLLVAATTVLATLAQAHEFKLDAA
jgi:hypothetical protein